MLNNKDEHPRQQLLDEISSQSNGLDKQLWAFKRIVKRYRIHICSFYERKQTRGLSLVRVRWNHHVVYVFVPNRADACLQSTSSAKPKWGRSADTFSTSVDTNSALLGIPDVEIEIPVDADHSDIVKFNADTNKTYESVKQHLTQMQSRKRQAFMPNNEPRYYSWNSQYPPPEHQTPTNPQQTVKVRPITPVPPRKTRQ